MDTEQPKKIEFTFKKKLLFSTIIIAFFFFVAEFSSLAFILLYSKYFAPNEYEAQIANHFFSKRWATINPAIYQYIEQNPKLDFTGDYHKNPEKAHPAHSILGWKLNQNIIYTNSGDISICNEQGFSSIGEAHFVYDKMKNKNQYRIIVLGGSTVDGLGASVPSENLPAQIQKHFAQKYPHLNIEVINAGVGGYESGQQLLYLLTELVNYKPDLVIAYDAWNDCAYNNLNIQRFGENWQEYKSFAHYNNEERLNISYSLGGAFSLFIEQALLQTTVFIKELAFVHLVSHVIEKLFTNIPKSTPPQAYDYYPKSAELYAQRHAHMQMLAQWHNFKLACFIQPLMGVDGKKYTDIEKQSYETLANAELSLRQAFYKDIRLKYDSLQKIYGKDNAFLFADISDVFVNQDSTVYSDSGHLLKKGNELVAKRILEVLEEKQFFVKDSISKNLTP